MSVKRPPLPAEPNLGDLQFVTRQQAAALLTINVQTIDNTLIRTGKLRAYRIGRRVLLKASEVLRAVEAHEIR